MIVMSFCVVQFECADKKFFVKSNTKKAWGVFKTLPWIEWGIFWCSQNTRHLTYRSKRFIKHLVVRI